MRTYPYINTLHIYTISHIKLLFNTHTTKRRKNSNNEKCTHKYLENFNIFNSTQLRSVLKWKYIKRTHAKCFKIRPSEYLTDE